VLGLDRWSRKKRAHNY